MKAKQKLNKTAAKKSTVKPSTKSNAMGKVQKIVQSRGKVTR